MQRRYALLVSLAMLLVVCITALATFSGRRREKSISPDFTQTNTSSKLTEQRKPDTKEDFPVVFYEKQSDGDGLVSMRRKEKNKRYDKAGLVSKKPNSQDNEVAVYYEGSALFEALPIIASNIILIGDVLEAHAYLSSDRTNVYSEFTINIVEILKNAHAVPVYTEQKLVVERVGGIVQYPDGQKVLYRIMEQGMPITGRRYLFFLNPVEQSQDYRILTGYELDGTVTPLDSAKQFDKYRGYPSRRFLTEVRDAIAQSY